VLENSFNDNKTAVRKRTEQVGTVVAIPYSRCQVQLAPHAESGRESVRFRNLFSPPDPL